MLTRPFIVVMLVTTASLMVLTAYLTIGYVVVGQLGRAAENMVLFAIQGAVLSFQVFLLRHIE